MSPFTLESDPIVNHLLIKSKDPKKNTVKKSIHINSPVLTLNEDMTSFNFSPKTNKNILDDMINKKNSKKPKKQQKPYYSDDEDDDSDEDDDDQENENAEDDSTDENTDQEIDKMKNSEANKLFDGSNILENSDFSDELIAKEKPLNNKSIKIDTDTAFVIQSTTPQPDILKKFPNSNSSGANMNDKKHSKTSSSSTSSSSAALINQLINQEKRNLATPVNPFPVRHVNSNIARNGVRLGLYK